MSIVLRNCVLIDGTGAEPVEGAAIVVEGDRILACGPSGVVEPRSPERVIDLQGMAVLPGLINLHVHYGLVLPGAMQARYRDESVPALAYRMADNARAALHAGVTTTRSVGERGGIDFALRASIAAGEMPGPRIFTGGAALAITGGHGVRSQGPALEADGPFEFRKRAREQLKLGADHIKIMISGGISGRFESIASSQMSVDEMQAVVEVTHKTGKLVCAHSGGAPAMLDAIRAGVDCLEHGYFIDDEVAALMVERGTFLVPTICVSRADDYMRRIGASEWETRKSAEANGRHWAALQTAIRHGVRIGMGTDMLPGEPNEGTAASYREMELMVEAGMTPMQVLLAATRTGAEILSSSDRFGTLERGKLADIVACEGNPALDMHALRKMRFVMQGGRVVRFDP
ncbi:MAG TPA: amidohydrolase family protein [Chloroflexota bacterium]